MYHLVAVPHRNHLFFGPRQSWDLRLGDVVQEISSDKLSVALRLLIADLPPEAASQFTTKMDVCLKVRDEAAAAAAQFKDTWQVTTAGIRAEEQAKNCLSAIRSEINTAIRSTPPLDRVGRTDTTVETPSATPNPIVPVAVGAAILAAVFLSS